MTEVFGVRPGSYWRAKHGYYREPKYVRKDGYRIQLFGKMYWQQYDCMRVVSIEQDSPTGATLEIVFEDGRSYSISYYNLRQWFERDFSRGV